jgi:uncharacterized protein with HEPN domain
MPREYKLYLTDILDAVDWLVASTDALTYDEFAANRMLRQAAERNCEIIGEAAKGVPAEIRRQLAEVDWKGMTNLRDVMAHRYHRLDYAIIWDAIRNYLPRDAQAIREYLNRMD